jgi:hypothetical protein
MASPDLRLSPYRKLKTLKQEIVPWAPGADIGRPNDIIENQDEVLAFLARKDEREYTRMERAEPIVHQGILRRIGTLQHAGWKLEPASAMPAARTIYDYGTDLLKRLRARFATNLAEMHRARFIGWRPMERIWDFQSTHKGKPAWFVSAIRAKEPADFRFTTARDLVWIASPTGRQIPFPFDSEESRLRWMICTSGDSDSPYGSGELKFVWMLYYLKREFMRMWSQGIQRSMGTVKVSQSGTSAIASFATREAQSAAGAPGQAKSVTEIAAEFGQVMKLFQESGILVQRNGWEVDLSGEVAYADGWKEPLAYLDRMMALCLTGDTLSLSAGTVGSKAAADTKSEELTERCVTDGQEISGWINEQLLGDAYRLQFPDPDPDDFALFSFKLGHEVDLDAAKWLFLSGARLDGKKIADEFGVPLIIDEQPGDVVLEKQQLVLDPATGRPMPAATAPPAKPDGQKPPIKAPQPDAAPKPGDKPTPQK